MSVIIDLIRRPRNFLNAIRLIYTLIRIRQINPKNSLRISFNIDPDVTITDLSASLSKNGSDKSTKHNYDQFYFDYLRKIKNNSGVVVEIGIGTNNPSIPSTMGNNGIPGASLRTFREFLPNMQILGADIDKEILFREDRIETFYLNQKDFESFSLILERIESLGKGIDFGVIDGLHQPLTDLISVRALLPHLKADAKLFVEDVFPNKTNDFIWNLAAKFFNKKYFEIKMHEAKSANLIEIRRNK